jgi:hypothetical protein
MPVLRRLRRAAAEWGYEATIIAGGWLSISAWPLGAIGLCGRRYSQLNDRKSVLEIPDTTNFSNTSYTHNL